MAKTQTGKGIGIQPLGDRVVVRPHDEKETKSPGGIFIPDTARTEKPERGVVVAVGPGKRGEKNEIIPVGVKVGDTVMFSKYGFDEVKVGTEDYYIISESSILAIIK
ncbi:MAG: co-chaperone GroES [Minisyncoccia bacterium]